MRARIKMLIDFDCPICKREAAMLQRLDRRRGCIEMENIADPQFDPARYGLTREQVDASIHGILPDGRTVNGMEVFRRAYDAVGFGWLLAPTGWPIARPMFDRAYRWFARNRHKIGRVMFRCDGNHCSPTRNAAS